MTANSGTNLPTMEVNSQSIKDATKVFFDLIRSSAIVDRTLLEEAMKESIGPLKELPQLMKYMLVVINVFDSNASFIQESASQLTERVLEHFWEGQLSDISDLYEKSTHLRSEEFKQFINKWEENFDDGAQQIEINSITLSIDIDHTIVDNLIKISQVYISQSINKYIHSIKNLWFDFELIQDEEKFNAKVKEIRSMILMGKNFHQDLESLISKEELLLDPPLATKSDIKLDLLSTILFEKPESENSIPFLTKLDIFSENPNLVINEKSLDKLAGYLSNGNKNKKEYINLIRIIFNKSMTKGFTIKDIVRLFFISKYEDYSERTDFEHRYDVKRLFVKSTLENVFDTLLKKLEEFDVIEIEHDVIQFKQQEKISFNYNYLIYDDY